MTDDPARVVDQGWMAAKLSEEPDALAPDGSEVRVLTRVSRGSMAHFRLRAGMTSKAVAHRSIEELWYFVGGEGEMWLKLGATQEKVVAVARGVSIAIPVGAHFQFRACGDSSLEAVGVSMPPWPGDEEAYEVPGRWSPSLASDSIP